MTWPALHIPRWFLKLAMAAGALALQAGLMQSPTSAPGPAAVPAYRQANRVAVINIEGEIDTITLESLERRVRKAKADGADAIVFDINTPGGDMLATLDINHLIRTECPANTVAWVNPMAFSAGTIIALNCREIIVAPAATFGDAAPIAFIPMAGLLALPAAERAKAEAPLLSEVVSAARRNHYDENLVRAFVSVGVELWMLEHVTTGERVFVDRAEYTSVFGEDPPQSITTSAPRIVPGQRVRPKLPFFMEPPSDGQPVDPAQIAREIEMQQTLPPRPALTGVDRDQWKLIAQVDSADQLLTVKADEALYYGLATATIADESQLKSYFGAQEVRRYEPLWSEGLVRVLVSWPVRLVLIAIFLVAFFLELATPGVGVFGATAFVAMAILIGAPALAGLAQWWDILLIGIGLAMVAVEMFVLPGTGLFGVVGVLALLVGMVGTFVSGDITTAQGQSELWTGLTTTLLSAFIAGIGIWLLSRWIHSVPVLNHIILKTELRNEDEGRSETGLLQAMSHGERALSVGDIGVAETDLRPSGRANFHGRLIDVKSVGSYIDKGTAIRVASVGRFVIEVEEAT
jgi:membrane-bound serine protease (ClpP class)